jgi:hypothetical protein
MTPTERVQVWQQHIADWESPAFSAALTASNSRWFTINLFTLTEHNSAWVTTKATPSLEV